MIIATECIKCGEKLIPAIIRDPECNSAGYVYFACKCRIGGSFPFGYKQMKPYYGYGVAEELAMQSYMCVVQREAKK